MVGYVRLVRGNACVEPLTMNRGGGGTT